MPSKVDICNEALNMLGANTISSLSESSTTAVLCNRIYDTEVDFLLRQHRWNSAMQEANLAAVTGTPIVGWLYKFLTPTDPYCLRVINVYDTSDEETNFEVRSRHIYADVSSIDITYVGRITDPNDFDSMLMKTLVDLLAYRMAFPITRSRETTEAMFQIFRNSMADAMSVDSAERTPEQIASEDLLDSRLRS
tara:strand:+ start:2392 stop:2970 length:579 start_codon:yes stop_codon:yes gene_type:complete